ncbi:MAG: hypothetical protein M1352_00665 [Patescibacteria group bacterium]|nr:hypothetical protein [Patescibacteria group bacterium]
MKKELDAFGKLGRWLGIIYAAFWLLGFLAMWNVPRQSTPIGGYSAVLYAVAIAFVLTSAFAAFDMIAAGQTTVWLQITNLAIFAYMDFLGIDWSLIAKIPDQISVFEYLWLVGCPMLVLLYLLTSLFERLKPKIKKE